MVIKRNFRHKNPDVLVNIYKSMVSSYIDYANSVWFPHRLMEVEKKEKVQSAQPYTNVKARPI